MAQFQNIYPIDLNIKKKGAQELLQPIGEGDANGVRVGAQVFADGAPVTLNGQCVAKVIRADGSTVPLTGTISGNIASVALDQQSCAVEGPIQVAVIWVSGTNVTTLVIAYGTIVNTISGTIIQPSAPIPDLTQLLAEIEAMRQATAAANAAATKAVRYNEAQTLTAAEQAQARGNISAPSAADLAAEMEAREAADSVLKSALEENEKIVSTDGYTVPFENIAETTQYIQTNGTWTYAAGGNLSRANVIAIPYKCTEVNVTALEDSGTYIAFLTDYSGDEASGSTPLYSANYTNRISIARGTTQSYKLYGDERYMYVLRHNSTVDNTPTVVMKSDVLHGTDATLSIEGEAADAKAVGTIVDGTIFPVRGNIVQYRTSYREGEYAYATTVGDSLRYNSNASYSTIIVPVQASSHYTCNHLRYLTLLDADKKALAVSSENVYEFDTTAETVFVCATFFTAENTIDNLIIAYGDHLTDDTGKHAIPWLFFPDADVVENLKERVLNLFPYGIKYEGNDQTYQLGTGNAIKKNRVITLNAEFTEFGTLTFSILNRNNIAVIDIVIDDTNVTVTNSGTTGEPIPHGITMSDRISVTAKFEIDSITYTVTSSAVTYTGTIEYSVGSLLSAKYAVADMTISNVSFAWTCTDFARAVWIYGDSYISNLPQRWMHYLIEDGYSDNCLIDGFSGENSARAYASISSYITMARPTHIVWCLGMNDGSDSSSAPHSAWMTGINNLLALCDQYGITPILATIPTVPSINHEQKNAWVRASGYQYIDFAKAVGAQSDGTWFSGMLSSDNVHPSTIGAKALYHQAITDCPQLLIDF